MGGGGVGRGRIGGLFAERRRDLVVDGGRDIDVDEHLRDPGFDIHGSDVHQHVRHQHVDVLEQHVLEQHVLDHRALVHEHDAVLDRDYETTADRHEHDDRR